MLKKVKIKRSEMDDWWMMSIKSSQLELTGHSTCLSLTCCHLLLLDHCRIVKASPEALERDFLNCISTKGSNGNNPILASRISSIIFQLHIDFYVFETTQRVSLVESSKIMDDEGSLTFIYSPETRNNHFCAHQGQEFISNNSMSIVELLQRDLFLYKANV